MKIALIGYGKMGNMLEKKAHEKGHEIVSIIDPATFGNCICQKTVDAADVCIEFTKPASVVENLKNLIPLKKQIVVGTTGWEEHLPMIQEMIGEYGVGLFAASNFSIGMNLFIQIVQEAAKKIIPTGLYDAAGFEAHHSKKIDAPSGTAKAISSALSESMGPNYELPFTSLRLGSIPGTHTVLFDSPFDTITLNHTARNREGFAEGALAAAEWMGSKPGFFTMQDLLNA